ncbi:MAG TPA: DsbA family oxidoreductase, partial [Trebonia sp.]
LFTAALAEFPHAGSVQIRQHSFELQPDLVPGVILGADEAAKAIGISAGQIRVGRAQLAAYCAELGLPFDVDNETITSTHAAHRVIQFAEARGKGHETAQRIARAYLGGGANIADPAVLATLAAQSGLDRDAAEAAATSEAFDARIEADRQLAGQVGVRGVPHFVFSGTHAVSGAQPRDTFLAALEAAWDARPAAAAPGI